MVIKMQLKNYMTKTIKPIAPFNFEKTIHKPSNFSTKDVAIKKNCIHFTTNYRKVPCGIKILNLGTVSEPLLEVSVYFENKNAEEFIREIFDEIIFRFDMLFDINVFYDDVKKDPILSPLINEYRGMRVKTGYSLYEYLTTTVLLQNATVGRTIQMSNNLYERYGTQIVFDGVELFCYWHPSELCNKTIDELKEAKVGYRAKTLLKQAIQFADLNYEDVVLNKKSKSEMETFLNSIYGVGPASIWYVLFDKFHYYDKLDKISPWEQKIYSRMLFDQELVPSDIIIKDVDKRWGKWKMLAVHYIFEDLFWKKDLPENHWLEELIRA